MYEPQTARFVKDVRALALVRTSDYAKSGVGLTVNITAALSRRDAEVSESLTPRRPSHCHIVRR
jgi:hypothetical protein